MADDENPPKRSGKGETKLKTLTKRLISCKRTLMNIDVDSGGPLGLMQKLLAHISV